MKALLEKTGRSLRAISWILLVFVAFLVGYSFRLTREAGEIAGIRNPPVVDPPVVDPPVVDLPKVDLLKVVASGVTRDKLKLLTKGAKPLVVKGRIVSGSGSFEIVGSSPSQKFSRGQLTIVDVIAGGDQDQNLEVAKILHPSKRFRNVQVFWDESVFSEIESGEFFFSLVYSEIFGEFYLATDIRGKTVKEILTSLEFRKFFYEKLPENLLKTTKIE